MSIQALGPVIESMLFKGAEYAVLVSLANHANEDACVWLGYETMAAEARLSVRHAKRVIKSLIDQGAVKLVSSGGGRYGTNEYEIDIERFEAAAAAEKGARKARRERRRIAARNGDTRSPPTSGGGVTSEAQNGDTMSPPIVTPDVTHTVSPISEPNAQARACGTRTQTTRAKRKAKRDSGGAIQQVRPPNIVVPDGREGELIQAALNGNDPNMPFKVKPWLGQFRFAQCVMGSVELKLVLDGPEPEFRSVFTGALKHLGLGGVSVWTPQFVHRQVDRGNARWLDNGPKETWFNKSLRQMETAHG